MVHEDYSFGYGTLHTYIPFTQDNKWVLTLRGGGGGGGGRICNRVYSEAPNRWDTIQIQAPLQLKKTVKTFSKSQEQQERDCVLNRGVSYKMIIASTADNT